MERKHFEGTWQQNRSFSPAVKTTGGSIVWIAGHTGQTDDNGKSLAGDLEAQVHQTFRNIERTLARAGGKLADIVTMTVFVNDVRSGPRLTDVRREIFGRDFP